MSTTSIPGAPTSISATAALSSLAASVRGRAIFPHDPDYDAARTLYNAMIDKRPAVIIQAADVADVITTVNAAAAPGSISTSASVSSELDDPVSGNNSVTVMLQANNLFDTMPPKDHSFSGASTAPYDSWNFNPYGRALYLEVRYGFGGN